MQYINLVLVNCIVHQHLHLLGGWMGAEYEILTEVLACFRHSCVSQHDPSLPRKPWFCFVLFFVSLLFTMEL